MRKWTDLKIGQESFSDIRELDNNFYYIDKTPLIKDLLSYPSKVTLFTRPRRFGKTLTMSMLKYFFEIGSDPDLFRGLSITNETELCEKHMGAYPVISLTFKDIACLDFNQALEALCSLLKTEIERFNSLRSSENLSDFEKNDYKSLLSLLVNENIVLLEALKF